MTEANIYRIKGKISNVYLINDEKICIVDSGSPNDYRAIRRTIEKELQRTFQDVDYIVPTHSHIEHMGYAPKLKQKTGGRIILSHKKINAAKGSMNSYAFLKKMPAAIWAGFKSNPILIFYPHLHFTKVEADLVAHDGMALPGHPGWTVVSTPGHSPDSICLFHAETGSLISGDTIITIKGKPALPFGIWSRERITSTLERLKSMPVRRIYPGHGDPLEGTGLLDEL